jgi:hypothetical protein
MKTSKSPSRGSLRGSVKVHTSSPTPTPEVSPQAEEEEVITTSLRLPKSMHDDLRRIVFEEGNRGNRVSIHKYILEGIAKVISERG